MNYKNCCTIGITSYGRLHYTKECIQAIHDTKGSYPFKIVVVNNYKEGEDEAVEWLKEQYNLGRIDDLCLMKKNVGISKGCNTAWTRYPKNKYFLKLDNDMIAKKVGWLDDMVAFLEKYPTFGTLGYNVEETFYPINFDGVSVKHGNIGGACVLINKYVESIVGFYNEKFGNPYSEEDCDLEMRLRINKLNNAYMADNEAFFHMPSGRAGTIDTSKPGYVVGGMEAELETEYRAWKDQWREKSVPLLYKEMESYIQDIKNTYCKTNAQKDFRFLWYKGEK